MALRIYKHHSEGGRYDKGRGWEGGQTILLNIYAFLVTIYLVIASHSFVLRKISIPEIWVDRKLKGMSILIKNIAGIMGQESE